MSNDENLSVVALYRVRDKDALQLGPRKRSCHTDPLIHHGRHFGRTVHAMCNVRTLLRDGLRRLHQSSNGEIVQQEREHRTFLAILDLIPGLKTRLLACSPEEGQLVADLIQKGISSARSDDTKSLKSVVIDWITPKGQLLNPPLTRNVKTDRGFHHDSTGFLLCPAGLDWSDDEIREGLRLGQLHVPGDQWPIFLYHEYKYDPENPWKGLLRSAIMVSAYKHVFTSPSSVGREPKATRSGNARIHGMTRVTPASIVYVATQLRFCLSSSPVFTRTDTVTDSERFYSSVLDLLEDPDEMEEIRDLLEWWNHQIFPSDLAVRLIPSRNSVLAKIRAKRAVAKAACNSTNLTSGAPATPEQHQFDGMA